MFETCTFAFLTALHVTLITSPVIAITLILSVFLKMKILLVVVLCFHGKYSNSSLSFMTKLSELVRGLFDASITSSVSFYDVLRHVIKNRVEL